MRTRSPRRSRPCAVHELFFTENAAARYPDLIEKARVAGVRSSLVTDRAIRALSDTVTPPGVVAVCDLLDVPLDAALASTTRLLAVPVAIGEPGNAGTVIRVADAVGRRRGDPRRRQRRPAQRQVCALLRRQPVPPADRARAEHRRRAGHAVGRRASRSSRPPPTVRSTSTRPTTCWPVPRPGCSATRRTDSIPRSRRGPTTVCGSPFAGAPRASTSATAAAICLYASARVQHRDS